MQLLDNKSIIAQRTGLPIITATMTKSPAQESGGVQARVLSAGHRDAFDRLFETISLRSMADSQEVTKNEPCRRRPYEHFL